MKSFLPFLLLIFLVACSSSNSEDQKKTPAINPEESNFQTTGSIERLDETIDALIPQSAVIEVLAEGFTWTEGPLWIADGQYLLFSDIPPNRIMKWSEKEGLSLYLSPSGYTAAKERSGEPGSNGLLLDGSGNLVLCQHGDRRMAKMNTSLEAPRPEFTTIIDKYEGKRFNSPNDAVYDSQGNLYFTDPPYGLEKNMGDPEKEIDFQGVYRYSNKGELSLVTNIMTRPNGIGLSPDETTLYVANSDPNQSIWMAFKLSPEGKVLEEKVFYDATGSPGKGLPDGLKVDKNGNIWATGPGGVWVFNAEAKVLGKILTGEATSNCGFDEEQQTLYMTCDDYLMRIKLK